MGGSSCQAAGWGNFVIAYYYIFSDTRGTSNLKFGELLQMLNSPKVPLELL